MTAPGATQVPRLHTGGGLSHQDWTRSRYNALLAAGVTPAAARAVVSQWALETGWGRAEWNYNLGNIRGFHSPQYMIQADGLDYVAYPTLADGVTAQLHLLQAPRYAAAWRGLQSDGDAHGWYSALMHAGWNPWSESTLNTYDGVLGIVDRFLTGFAPGLQQVQQQFQEQTRMRSQGRTILTGITAAAVIVIGYLAGGRYVEKKMNAMRREDGRQRQAPRKRLLKGKRR